MKTVLIVGIAVAAVLVLANLADGPGGGGAQPPSDAADAGFCTAARHAEARALVEKAMDEGWLAAASKGVAVYVRPSLWHAMDIEGKHGLARALDCAIAGQGKTLSTLDIRDRQSGRRLAHWGWGKLEID